MDLVLIVILLVLFWLISNSTKKEEIENFGMYNAVSWKELATKQCKELNEESKEIEEMLKVCSEKDDVKKDGRHHLNNKLSCRDAGSRDIFNTNEKNIWCAVSENKASVDASIMGVQPNNIINENLISDIFEDYNKQIKSNVEEKIKETDYSLIDGVSFIPYNINNSYALY